MTVNRKVQEIFTALAAEKLYTKDEIMEWYLNTIYLGEGCFGVQSAARVYFGMDVSELTTAECASVIGITNNPSLYDPYVSEKNNRKRQLTILKEMFDQGYIKTREEYETAADQELVFRNGTYDEETYVCAECGFEGPRSQYTKTDGVFYCPECGTVNETISSNSYYSWYADAVYNDVLQDLCKKFDCSEKAAATKLMTGGYKVYCNYNPHLQSLVDSVYENLENVPKTVSSQQLQSAIILIDNATGDIVAVSGGVGEKEGSLVHNRATMSLLPTGSSFKPIAVYAPALEAGIVTPATVYEDSSLYDDRNWPLNYSRSYSGLCTVMRGLTQSLNTISVKVLNDLGTTNSYKFLTEKMGITSLVENETIGGIEWNEAKLPQTGDVPLVSDVSSCFLSRPMDVSRYGLIWGGAQKNVGPAGVTIVIVRDDLIREDVLPFTPTIMRYKTQADAGSLSNTPPAYGIYVCGLVFKWLKEQGGLSAMQKRNQEKAALLYDYLDQSKLFSGTAQKEFRSLMNVPFITGDADLDAKFIAEAKARGLESLKGHRSVGGMRASIYNAMPREGVEALVAFMEEFEKNNA